MKQQLLLQCKQGLPCTRVTTDNDSRATVDGMTVPKVVKNNDQHQKAT